MTVISNTTVIANFAATGRLNLLRQIFGTICIPLGVYQEVQDGLDEGYAFNSVITDALFPHHDDGWLRLIALESDLELTELPKLPRHIHRGEAECLVIARNRNWLFLTDDRRARAFAKVWNIQLSGTLGCLVLAVERGYCTFDDGNKLLSRMLEQGYRSTIKDLSHLIQV